MGKYREECRGDYVAVATEPQLPYAAWRQHYKPGMRLVRLQAEGKVGAFVEGGANFLSSIGMPSATGNRHDRRTGRLLRRDDARYGHPITAICDPGTGRHAANQTADQQVCSDGVWRLCWVGLAMLPAKAGDPYGTGGLILWPLFGAPTRCSPDSRSWSPCSISGDARDRSGSSPCPTALMLVLPVWGLGWQMFHPQLGWWSQGKYLLFGIGLIVLAIQFWIVAESVLIWRQARGVLEEALPPLVPRASRPAVREPVASGGRSH